MLAKMRVAQPETTEITLTITLMLKEWKQIREALHKRVPAEGAAWVQWPMSELCESIEKATALAEQTFYGAPDEKAD